VLVTGPHNAGKSTFVRSASDRSASADWGGTTVALDHGHVSVDGLTADLFGTPGQARFDPILRTLAAQALGVIVVVDATDPDTLPRAREMLHRTTREGLPALIAANKQDQPGALAPEVIAGLLDVPSHARVVPCSARDPASARRVLQQLFEQILQGAVPA
jgi:small GTP-binding protein